MEAFLGHCSTYDCFSTHEKDTVELVGEQEAVTLLLMSRHSPWPLPQGAALVFRWRMWTLSWTHLSFEVCLFCLVALWIWKVDVTSVRPSLPLNQMKTMIVQAQWWLWLLTNHFTGGDDWYWYICCGFCLDYKDTYLNHFPDRCHAKVLSFQEERRKEEGIKSV